MDGKQHGGQTGGERGADTVGFSRRERAKTRIMCLPEKQEKEGMLLLR